MEITNLRPSGGGMMFDVHVTPDVILRDWQIKRTKTGLRAVPPSVRHGRTPVWLAPSLLEDIVRLVRDTTEGDAPNDRSAA